MLFWKRKGNAQIYCGALQIHDVIKMWNKYILRPVSLSNSIQRLASGCDLVYEGTIDLE